MKIVLAVLMILSLGACATMQPTTHQPETAQKALSSATMPSEAVEATLHPPPVVYPTVPYNEADVNCMAQVLYHEARGESDKGLEGVGYVVMNRVHDKHFPNTVCGVVHQGVWRHGHIVRNSCQFQWFCDGRPDTIHNAKIYAKCKELAKLIIVGFAPNPIGKCLYFHSAHRRRSHHRRLYVAQYRIGNQFFYQLADRS